MTTPDRPDAFHAQAYERDVLTEQLVSRGFAGDGDVLVGDVTWAGPTGQARTTVTVALDEAFPYAPPVVQLSAAHRRPDDPTPTFHLESDGALCLYDGQVEVFGAGWRDADRLLDQIAGWLEATAAGWPDDTDTDLERYLPQAGQLLRYDADELQGKAGALRLDGDRVRWIERTPERQAPGTRRSGKRRSGRRQARIRPLGAYLVDVGALSEPLLTWPPVLAAAGRRAGELDLAVRQRNVRVVVVRYSRGGRPGVLALSVRSSPSASGGVALAAMEAADVSAASRRLRGGDMTVSFERRRVAIVGCGAVGSYVADLLFRSGASRLTLIDPQILRPGNIVRHTAGDDQAGRPKVDAVRTTLAATGLSVEHVHGCIRTVHTLREASELALEHDLVIDATGDQRAAALLLDAALDTGSRLVKVCLQREGGIARVDRWPVAAGEQHAPSVPQIAGLVGVRERGCGDLVSLTPPHAVVTAAAHAVRTCVALLTGGESDPSVIDVLSAQADAPYDTRGVQVPRRTATSAPAAVPAPTAVAAPAQQASPSSLRANSGGACGGAAPSRVRSAGEASARAAP